MSEDSGKISIRNSRKKKKETQESMIQINHNGKEYLKKNVYTFISE